MPQEFISNINTMSSIQYSAVLAQNSITGEVCSSAISASIPQKSHLRSLALSIASQAKPGETACINSASETAYYVQSNQHVVVVFTRVNDNSRIPLAFLRDVQMKLKQCSAQASTQAVLEQAFKDAQQFKDQIGAAKSGMEDVRRVMVENIDEILQRNERLNLLVDRTSQMSQNANMFNRQATHLERRMWFQNFKLMMFAAVAVTGIGGLSLKLLL